NGEADSPGADRQPILLAAEPAAANGASHLILADGTFRDVPGFARVFLLFPPDLAPAARTAWRAQDGREGVERAYFAQEEGRWVKKG
ncbi:MAG TPA: DNA polymerase III subunit chi, partial [Erythrobacter sp.]